MARAGLRARLRKLRLRAWHSYNRKPLPLTIGLAVFSLLAGAVVQPLSDAIADEMQLQKWVPAGALMLIVAVFLVVIVILTPPQRTSIDLPDNIEVRRALSQEQLEKIRHGLHERIYGGVAPANDEINRMYAKNPRMGVALYHTGLDDYVAFATAWPLTDAAAKDLIAGRRTENDLTADDILPESQNTQVRDVLIPAFGASADEGNWQQRCYGYLLRNEMRRALSENFFGKSRRRKLGLIATGFSKSGERVCLSHGMRLVRHVRFADDGKEYPIFVGSIDRSDLV